MAAIARSNFRDVDDSEICRIRMRGRTRLLVLGMQGTGKSSLKRQIESSLFTERNNVGLIESSTVDSELVERADIICFVVDSTEPKFTENAEFLYHLLAMMDEFGKTKTDILVIFTKLDRLVTHSRMLLTSFLMNRLRGTLERKGAVNLRRFEEVIKFALCAARTDKWDELRHLITESQRALLRLPETETETHREI
ncbi:unnamed protein product [Malus baccata var. baccata]